MSNTKPSKEMYLVYAKQKCVRHKTVNLMTISIFIKALIVSFLNKIQKCSATNLKELTVENILFHG